MAVTKYLKQGRPLYRVTAWVYEAGVRRHKIKGGLQTKEQADRLAKTWAAESVDGTWFDRAASTRLLVREAWETYEASSARLDSHGSDCSRAKHLLRLLGAKSAAGLSQADVDAYRAKRAGEWTARHAHPSSATLDREVELLKRVLGYVARCGKIQANPLAGVSLLREPNVRETVLTEEEFLAGLGRLESRSAWMAPVLLTAWDTGMRIGEVLGLRRDRIDWQTGRVELQASETKTEEPRVVYLSVRVLAALKVLPAHVRSPLVFWRIFKGRVQARTVPRRGFKTAFGPGVNVHDLRHSFATNTRKSGIPESVVMKMGGWRTAAMFRRYNLVDETDVREAQQRLDDGRGPATGSILDRSGKS